MSCLLALSHEVACTVLNPCPWRRLMRLSTLRLSTPAPTPPANAMHPTPKCPCLCPTSCLLALSHEVACTVSNPGPNPCPTRRVMHRPRLSTPAPTPVQTVAPMRDLAPKCPLMYPTSGLLALFRGVACALSNRSFQKTAHLPTHPCVRPRFFLPGFSHAVVSSPLPGHHWHKRCRLVWWQNDAQVQPRAHAIACTCNRVHTQLTSPRPSMSHSKQGKEGYS